MAGSRVSVTGGGSAWRSGAAERRASGRLDVRDRRSLRGVRIDNLGRLGDERALGLERQERRCLVEGDPADLVELVVVAGEVAPDRLHQEVVDGLVDPGAALDEPVLDRVEDVRDPDLETGLLGDLAEGGLLAGLTGVGRALRERPRQDVAIAPTRTNDERRNAVVEANDDAAGRSGGCRPQPRHGAVAAPDRRVEPATSEPVQRNAT